MEEGATKINFFKKFYLSIFKIKEYSKLSNERLKSAIKYMLKLLLMLGILYSIILIVRSNDNMNKLKSYLEKNIPEFTYKNNTLNIDSKERIILDNELIKINFGGKIIIDTSTNYNVLINEYKNEEEGTVILARNKFTTISNGNVKENTYDEVLEEYFVEKPEMLNKGILLQLFSKLKNQYSVFVYIIYILAYIISQSIYIFIYTLVITIIFNIVCKIKKIDVRFSEIYIIGLYATTILACGQLITLFIPNIIGTYLKIVYNISPILYTGAAIYISKWITPGMVK